MSDKSQGKECVCKDCGNSYTITPHEEHYYTQSRLGLKQMTLPVRCPKCRAEHHDQVRNLARATVSIPNAETGEGCFIGLTSMHLSKTSGWKTSFQWEKVAPANYPNQPQAVMFNVDQKLAGLFYFEDLGPKKGLAVKAYDYAPWIDEYQGGREALFQYMVSESMRRGYAGAFTINLKPADLSIAKKLGMKQHSASSQTYGMSAGLSQTYILRDAGVRDETIQKLVEKDTTREADLAWISLKLGQKKLAPIMVDEISNAKSGVNWRTLQRYVENPRSLKGRKRDALLYKLQGILGQLHAVEYLRSRDPSVTLKTEMPMMGQSVDVVVAFSRKTAIDGCIGFDQTTQKIKYMPVVLNQGQGCAMECKAWGIGSYLIPSATDVLIQEVRKAVTVHTSNMN